MNKIRLNTRQHGFTLIEIMIALVLGAFLIGGVLQIFLNSKQTYRMQDNLSRMQENGRFAMEFISRVVREAGYREWGCSTGSSSATAVAGTNDSGFNGSDTVTVTKQDNTCGVATKTFSIQTGASGQPALFKKVNGAPAVEMIEGIENMQILYGEDTDLPVDGTPNYYVPADQVVHMSKVVSVRISLLAVSLEDNLTSQPVPYTYNRTPTTPTDRKLRRVFTSTIALRNRL